MHKTFVFRLLSLVSLILAVTSLTFFSSNQILEVETGSVQIALKAPTFVESARAASPDSIASVLDSEAGISAYFQAPIIINLDNVRGLFHTIEIETSDYILGSIPIPDNREEYDAHVYIHKSGWIMAYYLRDEPAVKIFDWQTYAGTMNPTRLQSVLNEVSTGLGLPDPILTYYDFRYPNATNLLLVVEDGPGESIESFDILDTNFTYFEKSWGIGGALGDCWGCTGWANYKLDGVEIHRVNGDNVQKFDIGFFEPTELTPINPHTITIYMASVAPNYALRGALAIVYGP
jgi:hypothetical protein